MRQKTKAKKNKEFLCQRWRNVQGSHNCSPCSMCIPLCSIIIVVHFLIFSFLTFSTFRRHFFRVYFMLRPHKPGQPPWFLFDTVLLQSCLHTVPFISLQLFCALVHGTVSVQTVNWQWYRFGRGCKKSNRIENNA